MIRSESPARRRFLGTAAFGLAAAASIALDVGFVRRARRGVGVVERIRPPRRAGPSTAEVLHRVDGESIEAEAARIWGCRLAAGDRVGILFEPDDPRVAVVDRPWPTFYRSILALMGLGIAASAEFAGRPRTPRDPDPLDASISAAIVPDALDAANPLRRGH